MKYYFWNIQFTEKRKERWFRGCWKVDTKIREKDDERGEEKRIERELEMVPNFFLHCCSIVHYCYHWRCICINIPEEFSYFASTHPAGAQVLTKFLVRCWNTIIIKHNTKSQPYKCHITGSKLQQNFVTSFSDFIG